MIKLAENTKILRVVKVRVNCKELQKESIILGSSNKIAKKKKIRGDKGEIRHALEKNIIFFVSDVVLVDYYYHLDTILR